MKRILCALFLMACVATVVGCGSSSSATKTTTTSTTEKSK